MKAVLALLAAVTLCAGLRAQEEVPSANRTETLTESLVFGSKLWVKNHNGAITVNGWDKEEVTLVAEIRDSDQRRVDLVVQRLGADLDIEAQFLQPKLSLVLGVASSPRCRMTLKVPRRLLGYFRTVNGALAVSHVDGYVRCETTNGDIALGDLSGEVWAETSNGNVTAKELHARIKGGTSNGGILLQDVAGQVKMETTNGFIQAENLNGWGEGISLECTNGPIDLDLGRATGDIVAESANGSLRIRVAGGQLLELGKHRVRVRVPGKGQKIALQTTNGNIHVH